MGLVVRNVNLSLSISLTVLKFVGFWSPDVLENENEKIINSLYTVFWFMFLLGIYLIIQIVDMFMIWGDLPLMTGTAFVLFTNLAQTGKIVNLLLRRKRIKIIISDCDHELRSKEREEGKKIIRRCDREMVLMLIVYVALTTVTLLGWATSAEPGKLPLRAWYPYDTSRSPAYELTYAHQVGALFVAAYLNVGKDTLVATLIAQCKCRLQLLVLALRTMCDDMEIGKKLTVSQEELVTRRLGSIVLRHQAVLAATLELQDCFSAPTFAQFMVSLIIICVTAFQLVSVTGNPVRLLAMGTYLLNMIYQVFLYCYQGNHLSEESTELAVGAYQCPWYAFPVPLRRSLLILMARTKRIAKLTAGGFTTLTLASFMAIIKASYSLFTLLQQVTE